MLVPHDKSSLMKAIDEVPAIVSAVDLQPPAPANSPVPTNQVLIVDAMAVSQSMDKLPGMIKICHLKEAFVRKIGRMTNVYDEARVVFDRSIEDSLKSQTRAKRATSTAAASASYDVHDQRSIKINSLKEHIIYQNKLLAEALLVHLNCSSKKLVMFYDTATRMNSTHSIRKDINVQWHE